MLKNRTEWKSRQPPLIPSLCGFYGDTQEACTCAAAAVTKYQRRISGPLLNCIDIVEPHRSSHGEFL
ncbi:MAG TPA: ATP-binding protein [Anaerolineales bacterium]|nr:ATP-binding protein [Anaerolineales bacterium]